MLRIALRLPLVAFIAFIVAVSVQTWHTALQRWRQRQTMSDISALADRMDKGAPVTAANDAWNRPMRIRRAGRHYSIASAGADGVFEPERLRQKHELVGYTFASDIVLIDRKFHQVPYGI